MRTSAGTTLTASPPLVMIGWMRTVSRSQKLSRWQWIAFSAICAADSALMPRCGEPPACEARPVNRICLISAPFDDSTMNERVRCSSCEPRWIIIAMSISSKWPLATSSGLPSRNSISPRSRRRRRSSTSMNSSAGTAKNTISPARCSVAPDAASPIATPSMPATWALWPQLCAAPVCGSASGCSEVRRLSSSPSSARRGPGLPPRSRPLTPVSPRPVCGARPSSRHRLAPPATRSGSR